MGARFLCAHTVYDVSNRESFEALPRWLGGLETYVSPDVVKIVVGNKLDKVRRTPQSPFPFSSRARVRLPNPHFPLSLPQEYSCQVPTTEGAGFAARMGCLFVEASAKTAVGVTSAFSRSLNVSSIRLRCGARRNPGRHHPRLGRPQPRPIAGHIHLTLCRGLSICRRRGMGETRVGVCVGAFEHFFFFWFGTPTILCREIIIYYICCSSSSMDIDQ
jgi:hypothetical protein